jgi:hypothetical protein
MDTIVPSPDKPEILIPVARLDIKTEVVNPKSFPWEKKITVENGVVTVVPIEDGTIDEVSCLNVLEFVPGYMRGELMEEMYRVLKVDGKATIVVPYWNCWTGVHDFRYEMPPLCEQSFLCFNKVWRAANKPDMELNCDFDFTYGYTPEQETAARNEESRAFYIKHYTNSIMSLHLLLTKRAPESK